MANTPDFDSGILGSNPGSPTKLAEMRAFFVFATNF